MTRLAGVVRRLTATGVVDRAGGRLRSIPRRAGTGNARERGSAVVTVVVGCALGAALITAILAVGAGTVRSVVVAGVADQAALAAADARAGLVLSESPCAAAAVVAAAHGVRVESCDLVEDSVEVRVIDESGPFPFEASARAGPAPSPHALPRIVYCRDRIV